MIPKTFIEELKSRAEVLVVVGRYVELKKKGANYQGLCPFHSEKKGSFSVSPPRGTYHCFGCGAHGDPLRFLQEHLGLSFLDAVKELAAQVGMQVPDEEASSRKEQQRDTPTNAGGQQPCMALADVFARADAHYRAQLRKSDQAVASLKRRGLTGETARAYRVGYAAGPRNLAGVFAQYDAGELLDAGLVAQREDGSRHDVFVDSVTFPVRNHEGAVVGFIACPVTDDDSPPYSLSRPSAAFRPDRVPYGLFEAKEAIQASGYAVVAEGGCLSVLALAQCGIGNAVCAAKDPLSLEHLKTLLQFSKRVMFLCQSNAEGEYQNADAYARLTAQLPGEFRIALLPSQVSPVSCLRSGQVETIREQMTKARPIARQSAASAA